MTSGQKKVSKWSLALLLSLLSQPLLAWDEGELLAQLAANEQPARAFVEERLSALLEVPTRVEGSLSYHDGRLEKRITHPWQERFVIKGNTLSIERAGEAPRIIDLRDYPPLYAFISVFRATLAGDLATLQRHFTTHLAGNHEAWTLTLRPREGELGAHIDTIAISGGDGAITTIDTLQRDGDRITLTLGPLLP